jgi:hypothetical protein
MQLYPQVLKQMNDVIDPYKRQFNVNTGNSTLNVFARTGASLAKNIPAVSYLLPKKVDAEGNAMRKANIKINEEDNPALKAGKWVASAAGSFLNPFSVTEMKRTPVSVELKRLSEYATKNGISRNFIPILNKTTLNDVPRYKTMNNQQLLDFQQSLNKEIQSQYESVMSSGGWENASEERKMDILADIREKVTKRISREIYLKYNLGVD